MRFRSFCFLAAAGMLAACENPAGGESSPGIEFLSGHAQADTVEAVKADLVVQVRGPDGRPAPGVVVNFQVPPEEYDVVEVGSSGQAWSWYEVADTTGSDGRASARIVLGTRAGTGHVVVSVPSLGYQDTAQFTVQPGRLASIQLSPRDTAVYAGASYPLTATPLDRHGNARTDAVAFTAGTARASVAGGAVRGESIGRGYVVATSAARQDTAWVSVVPQGVLAASAAPLPGSGAPGSVVVLNTDGSEFRELREGTGASAPLLAGGTPSWSPDGRELAVLTGGRRLLATGLAGGVRVIREGDPRMVTGWAPLYSPDGAWIYFVRDNDQVTFWRVRVDGTAAQQASEDVEWGREEAPAPAPAGGLVAYHTNRATNSSDFTLRIINVHTGAVTALDVPGRDPRWSPNGEWIAYRQNVAPYRLRLMRPDGTGIRAVADVDADAGFSWSPDGQWLVVSGSQPRPGAPFHRGLSLVNVATGEVLPLPFQRELSNPAWRP